MAEKGRAGGNRGFGDTLAATYDKDAAPAPARPVLPTDSVLASRATTLGELASGKLVTERTMWVAAARCRPWAHHNRDQAQLNADSCADLIDSFKAEGRQRLPAIVRRLKDDDEHDYEIIAGVRRHWTVRWLNEHNYPNFEFLVTIQSLTDEEAFRVADIENRARLDLTDLERARDYLKALDLFYGGKQRDMATRLNVSEAWLSRLLELARLPDVVINCFADPRDLKVEHVKQLAPKLAISASARPLLAAAAKLAVAQRDNAAPLRGSEVVRALLAAAAETVRRGKTRPAPVTIASAARRPMLRVTRRARTLVLELLPASGATRTELQAALAAVLDDLPGDVPLG